jgi:ubiquinone/menaquinone biosynthesis C-methylase UbiE
MTTIPFEQPATIDSGMPDIRITFYRNTIDKWIADKKSSILVVGGGDTDREVLHGLGFTNVVISNIDSRLNGDEFAPYQWSFQKAECLSYSEAEFDFVLVHAALHHCESPHKALLEMYRVAKIGLVAFESRDSLLMQFLVKVGLSPDYEDVAVYYNGGKFGGVNNTEIPNYIYRWTEREIEKTISSYAPIAKHHFFYQYGNDIPNSVGLEKKSLKKIIVSLVKPFYHMLIILLPKQQNLFAFYVKKPDLPNDLYQWLKIQEGKIKFDYHWGQQKYK